VECDEEGPPGPVQQIDAGLLNVGYVDAGPADGPAVLLLHGWPYDIHSYADVVPRLVAEGSSPPSGRSESTGSSPSAGT